MDHPRHEDFSYNKVFKGTVWGRGAEDGEIQQHGRTTTSAEQANGGFGHKGPLKPIAP